LGMSDEVDPHRLDSSCAEMVAAGTPALERNVQLDQSAPAIARSASTPAGAHRACGRRGHPGAATYSGFVEAHS
jgi:hypothetical protein